MPGSDGRVVGGSCIGPVVDDFTGRRGEPIAAVGVINLQGRAWHLFTLGAKQGDLTISTEDGAPTDPPTESG